VKRAVVQERETGSLERKPIPGCPRRSGPEREAALRGRLEAAPDATVLEHCAWWAEHYGQQLSEAAMWRAIRRLGWTHKKRHWQPCRARRGGTRSLACGRGPTRSRAPRLCRRERHDHRPDSRVWLGAAGAAGHWISPAPPRQDHHVGGRARPRWAARAVVDRGSHGDGLVCLLHHRAAGADAAAGTGPRAGPTERPPNPPTSP